MKQFLRSFFNKMAVQILSYHLIKAYSSQQKVKKILDIVKKGDIIVLEGRLTSEEELSLTSSALQSVSGKFTGIEIAFLDSNIQDSTIEKIKASVLKLLAKERYGITVIGPSKVVKEIKMDPNKLEILFN